MKSLKKLELTDHLRILWRRRWYFLVSAVVISSGVTFVAWRLPEFYKSETRIMVDTPLVPEDRANRITPEERIESIRQQLASRTFLERMIEEIPMFGYGRNPDFVMEKAVKQAQRQIGIGKASGNMFTLSFVAGSPGSARKVTRELANELIRKSSESRKSRIADTDQFIDEQLSKTKSLLDEQGEKIKRFKMAHLGELPEQGSANINVLNGMHSQLAAAENAIQQAQERLKLNEFKWQERKRMNQLSQSVAATDSFVRSGNRAIQPLPEEVELASKKSLLTQYMAKYTPEYPDVITLKRDIETIEQQIKNKKSSAKVEATTPDDSLSSSAGQQARKAVEDDPQEAALQYEADSIKAEIARREKDKQTLLQQIKLYQSRLNLAPGLERDLTTLFREEEVLKTQFADLQKRKFGTQMADAVERDSRNETYRIIDEANLPVTPEYPNKAQIALMGLLGGIMLGIGAAYGRELLDTTIGSEAEAQALLDFPVLASIPTVPKEKKTGRRIA